MGMIEFFVPGIPRATQTGSVVRAGGRLFPVRRRTEWSAYCALIGKEHAPGEPLEGPLVVSLQFFVPRPKDKRKTEPVGRPDLENLSKGLLDCWNGILWRDDSQVVFLGLRKSYSAAGRVGVQVQVAAQTR